MKTPTLCVCLSWHRNLLNACSSSHVYLVRKRKSANYCAIKDCGNCTTSPALRPSSDTDLRLAAKVCRSLVLCVLFVFSFIRFARVGKRLRALVCCSPELEMRASCEERMC